MAEPELISIARKELDGKNLLHLVDSALLTKEIRSATGLPAAVSK